MGALESRVVNGGRDGDFGVNERVGRMLMLRIVPRKKMDISCDLHKY